MWVGFFQCSCFRPANGDGARTGRGEDGGLWPAAPGARRRLEAQDASGAVTTTLDFPDFDNANAAGWEMAESLAIDVHQAARNCITRTDQQAARKKYNAEQAALKSASSKVEESNATETLPGVAEPQ